MTPRHVRATPRHRRAVLVCTLVVSALLEAADSSGAELRVRGGLSYGFDSNPLELPVEGPSGAFTQVEGGVSLDPSQRARFGFIAEADGLRRWYASEAADAGFGSAGLRAGIVAIPYVNGPSKLALVAGGTYAAHRATFVDPYTADIYEVISGSGGTVSVPDRLDFDSMGAFGGVRWQPGGRFLLFVDGEWVRRDFVHDYEEIPGLDPLDDRSLSLQPGVRVRIARGLVAELSWSRQVRTYDELPSLDENATPVEGEERRYVSSLWQTALRFTPSRSWELTAGYRTDDRSDRYAGYYDSRGTGAILSATCSPAGRTRLRLLVSSRTLDYSHASVNNEPGGDLRQSDLLGTSGEVAHDVAARVTIFAQGGAERSESRDPVYAYRRSWVSVGIRTEL